MTIDITPEQFGAWKQSPVGRVFFQYCRERSEAIQRDAMESWLATGQIDGEARGRILELREIATPTLDMIKQFYGELDAGRQDTLDRAEPVRTGDLYG